MLSIICFGTQKYVVCVHLIYVSMYLQLVIHVLLTYGHYVTENAMELQLRYPKHPICDLQFSCMETQFWGDSILKPHVVLKQMLFFLSYEL